MALRFITVMVMALLLFSSKAYARIGETPEQCKQRYGPPVEDISEDNALVFKKSGLIITAQFFNGKVDRIIFRKLEQNILGQATEMTENEIRTLLKANSSKDWQQRNVISMNREYETEDGSLYAGYATMKNMLVITTKEFINRMESSKKAKEDEQLKGF